MSTSNNDLTLDVGQANEFKLAARKAGYTNADIKAMCEGNMLSDFLKVIKGQAEIKIIEHLIDCDVAPFVPEGWTVVENRQCGKVRPDDADLYMSEEQKNGPVSGNELQKKLADLPVLNAAMLDWYLAHSERIPEAWRGKLVFFWGTIYRDANGYLFVRVLDWNGDQWNWDGYCLGYDFSSSDPAAVASL